MFIPGDWPAKALQSRGMTGAQCIAMLSAYGTILPYEKKKRKKGKMRYTEKYKVTSHDVDVNNNMKPNLSSSDI